MRERIKARGRGVVVREEGESKVRDDKGRAGGGVWESNRMKEVRPSPGLPCR